MSKSISQGFSLINAETEKAAIKFFKDRGCDKIKPFIVNKLTNKEFLGQRAEYITNGGKRMTIKRFGMYNDLFVVTTGPSDYAKNYEEINKIKQIPCYNGTVMLKFSKNKGKRPAGYPECMVLMFEGEPLEIIAALDKVVSV